MNFFGKKSFSRTVPKIPKGPSLLAKRFVSVKIQGAFREKIQEKLHNVGKNPEMGTLWSFLSLCEHKSFDLPRDSNPHTRRGTHSPR